MTTSIQTTGIDLTPSVRTLVDDKLAAAFRPLGGEPSTGRIDVELDGSGAGGVRAEVTLHLGRSVLRSEATERTLERAVVEVKHVLTRRVRRWHDRSLDAQHEPSAGAE